MFTTKALLKKIVLPVTVPARPVAHALPIRTITMTNVALREAKISLLPKIGINRRISIALPVAFVKNSRLFSTASISREKENKISAPTTTLQNLVRDKESTTQYVGSTFEMHKGEIIDNSGQKVNDCYVLLRELRKDDVFPSALSKKEMIELFFPKNSSDLALSLSNVTSAFYGIMLETCGKSVGFEKIDKTSRDFFYKLGRVKAKMTAENIAGKFQIPKDARGVVILLVSAIYNASPEYKFEIKQYDKEFCEISLRGVDRYYRITSSLKIEKHLQWPVLHTFMEGIKDELSIDADIQSEMVSVENTGECHERFLIKRR